MSAEHPAAQGHDPAVCEEVERTYQAEVTSQEILMHEYQAEIGRLRAEIERLRAKLAEHYEARAESWGAATPSPRGEIHSPSDDNHTPPSAVVRNLSSTAWLVERGQPERQSPTVWRIAGPKPNYRDGEQWTEDAYMATRYASWEEAQAVVDALFTGPAGHRSGITARATEHGFIKGAN